MPKTTTLLIVSLLISVCIPAPTQASPGNKYGWCQGVGNPHQSAGCGGLPPNPPQTVTPVVTVNSVNENRPQPGVDPPQQLPQPVIAPPQPPAQQVPTDPVIAVPQPVLPPQQVPQPMVVPPQPPAQQVPPDPVIAPPQPPQQVPQPVIAPPQPPQQVPQPVIAPPQPPQQVPQPVIAPPQQVPPDPVIAVPQPVLPPQQVPQPTIGAAQIPVTSHLTAPSGHQNQIFQPMTLVVPDPGRQQAGRLHRIVLGEAGASAHNVCLVSGMGRRKLREADVEVGQFSGFHLTDAIVRDLPFDRHPYAGCFISVERRWHDRRLPSEEKGQ